MVHPVLAKNRPDHGGVTTTELVAPVANSNPVVFSWAYGAPARVPGQMVKAQLFLKVIVAEFPPAQNHGLWMNQCNSYNNRAWFMSS